VTSAVVLDASALIAVLRVEPGADVVKRHLRDSYVSSVNVAEVLCKSRSNGASPEADAWALSNMGLIQVPFDFAQAQIVASIRELTAGGNVGLADRACMALGIMQNIPVLTGDREWTKYKLPVEVKLFRK
jgi:ribonuclease VapC